MSTTSNQAIAATLSGNWESAIELNKNLLKDKPDDIEALNRIGLAYTVTGDAKNAKRSYKKVLDLDPLNAIALKNLKKLENDAIINSNTPPIIQVNNIFIEETGRTKVVELINLAQQELLMTLRTGQSVNMSVKRLKIFIHQEKNYIGMLPDDIGNRLIKFINGGNKYEAYVKSANHQNVSIFIRELKKCAKFKDQPSFIHAIENKLNFDDNKKEKKKKAY